MARTPAKPKAAAAAKPDDLKTPNTQGAEDSLKDARAPKQAEAQAQPSETQPNGGANAAWGDLSEDEPGPVIKITGPELGRRRIGRRFGPAPVEIAIEDLTAEDLAALLDDPALKVSIPDSGEEYLSAAFLRPV